jgi:phytanoyl-CoA hydroxylase
LGPVLDETGRRRFRSDGFAIVPFLTRDEAESLSKALLALAEDRSLDPTDDPEARGEAYHASFMAADDSYRCAVARLIRDRCAAAAAVLLPGFEPVIASSVIKAPFAEGASFHMDLTIAADPAAPVVNIWCPLVDASDENGTLRVVPGSHRLFPQISSMETTSGYWRSWGEALMARSVPLDLVCGEAIVYDGTLLHGSRPNASARLRPAINLAYIPADVRPVAYSLDPASGGRRFEMFDMSGDGLVAHGGRALLGREIRAPSLGFAPSPNRNHSLAEFDRRRRALRARRAGGLLSRLFR